MKESEAKTKRCCGPYPCGESRAVLKDVQYPYFAIFEAITMQRYCIGSECMAWQRESDESGSGHCGLVKQ